MSSRRMRLKVATAAVVVAACLLLLGWWLVAPPQTSSSGNGTTTTRPDTETSSEDTPDGEGRTVEDTAQAEEVSSSETGDDAADSVESVPHDPPAVEEASADEEAGAAPEPVDEPVVPSARFVVVVLGRGGEPLEGAGVRNHAGGEGITDEEGQVVFDAVALDPRLGTPWVSVVAFGYRTTGFNVTDVVPNQTRHVLVRMQPMAMISLRPVDAYSGEPIDLRSNSRVRIHGERDRPGYGWTSHTNVVADEDGTTHLLQVRTGRQRLEIWPRGYDGLFEEFVFEGHEHVDLGTVAFRPGVRLAVELVDKHGEPLAGVELQAVPLQVASGEAAGDGSPRGPLVQGETDEQGQWRSPRVGGSHVRVLVRQHYSLERGGHSRGSYAGTLYARVEPLPARSEWLELRIVLDTELPNAVVRGVATHHHGGPLAQRRIYLVDHRQYGWWSLSTTTDEAGHFRFDDVPPGRFRLTVRPQSGLIEPDDRFEVRLGDELVRNYSLANDMTRGRLLHHDGTPAVNMLVSVLWRANHEPNPDAQGRTDSDGRFALLDDLPVSYERGGPLRTVALPVFVRIDVEPGRVVLLRKELPPSRDLGEMRLRALDPASRATLKLRVTDAVTGAFANVTVDVRGRDLGEIVERRIRVDGQATLDDLPPGEYRIQVPSVNFARFDRTVQLEPYTTKQVVVPLARPAAAELRLSFTDGGATLAEGAAAVSLYTDLLGYTIELNRRLRTNGTRTLRLLQLAADAAYTATIRVPGYAEKTIRFTTQGPGTTKGVDVTLVAALCPRRLAVWRDVAHPELSERARHAATPAVRGYAA